MTKVRDGQGIWEKKKNVPLEFYGGTLLCNLFYGGGGFMGPGQALGVEEAELLVCNADIYLLACAKLTVQIDGGSLRS